LGNELTGIDRLDEAEKALNNARNLNPNSDWLWRYLAELYRKQKNLGREIEALENLCAIDEARWTDLNELGIAYYNHKNFAKALEYYRFAAKAEPSIYPWFNMGLVFNDPEVSQDADAADAYRHALTLNPDYGPAKERLETTKMKLVPLAERAIEAAKELVQTDDQFRFYLSPFEVLQLETVESIEKLDVKVVHRAKNRLLQEIDLNDGKVSWLNDCSFNKTKAFKMEDELIDETKRHYHWAVVQNKYLLAFMTRGDIRHFLFSDEHFPLDTLELLDEEPEFRTFLSKPFARQYNLVLTLAIERRLLPVVEVLFDGRRWVNPEDDDICFEGAYKRIGDLVELMRNKAAEGRTRKVSLQEIEDFLQQHCLPGLFNLLPTTFAHLQKDLVAEIRSLAISCFNEHSDADLSRAILSLCKRFKSRSIELNTRLGEDFHIIERMIAEERKYESHLTFGPDRPFDITNEGIRDSLLHRAEEARIALSTQSSAEIDLSRSNIEDENGRVIDDYMEITRSEYESLIKDSIDNTAEMMRKILTRNSLRPQDLKFILMVGGSTYTPFVRDRIEELLGIPVNTGIDPTNAIAIGAAYFAGTKEINLKKKSAEKPSQPGLLKIRVSYNRASQDREEMFSAKIVGDVAGFFYRITSADGSCDSGLKKLTPRISEDLPLQEDAYNLFAFRIYDGQNNPVSTDVDSIQIASSQYTE